MSNQIALLDKTGLAEEVIAAIKNIAENVPTGRGDGEWTLAVKRSLIALGKQKGYDICASGFPSECEREWLYDLVWYRNEPEEHLREIALILESEWSLDPFAVKYDFEKLLVGKCPLKVMVFQDFNGNSDMLWSMLEKGIHTFQTKHTNETYILAAYQNREDAFSFRTVVL